MQNPSKKPRETNSGSFGAHNRQFQEKRTRETDYERQVVKLEGLQVSALESIKALQKQVPRRLARPSILFGFYFIILIFFLKYNEIG